MTERANAKTKRGASRARGSVSFGHRLSSSIWRVGLRHSSSHLLSTYRRHRTCTNERRPQMRNAGARVRVEGILTRRIGGLGLVMYPKRLVQIQRACMELIGTTAGLGLVLALCGLMLAGAS